MWKYIGDFEKLKDYGFRYISVFTAYYYDIGNISVGDETRIDPDTREICGVRNNAIKNLIKDGLAEKVEE